MTLTDFLLARIAEDEMAAKRAASHVDWVQMCDWVAERSNPDVGLFLLDHWPARVLAECEAKRRIVDCHKAWPVLAQTPPTVEPVNSADPSAFAMRASQQMAWLTEQAYRDQFGSEPPTGPVLRLLALAYADHPDYREDWRP